MKYIMTALILITVSCGGAKQTKAIPENLICEMKGTKAQVWQQLLNFVEDQGHEVALIEKDSWMIKSDSLTIEDAEKYYISTFSILDMVESGASSLSFRIMSESKGICRVRVKSSWTISYRPYNPVKAFPPIEKARCESTGIYEGAIMAELGTKPLKNVIQKP